MNKMDIDMHKTIDTAEDGTPTRPSRALLLRRAAVIGAPLLVIAGGVIGCMTLVATGPQLDKNKEPPRPVAVQIATR